jgi:hypothetical protein
LELGCENEEGGKLIIDKMESKKNPAGWQPGFFVIISIGPVSPIWPINKSFLYLFLFF